MPKRVSPTERIRAEIDELFGSGRDIAEVLGEVMRLSARLVLQEVLEDEVTTWLGRDWNSRAEGERAGRRNGYSDLTSRICQRLRDQFEAFRTRDLSDVELDYLFLDGSHFKMHDGSRSEPVLVAYGITTVGQPVLLAVEPGGDESHDAWAGFLEDLKARGLRAPLLVISDGASGLLGAVEHKVAHRAAATVSDPPGPQRGRQGARR
ncbi:transposase, partial [Rhabdothermincola sediminis]|uniref:transposase n=1 Tax=Rhabdothermincola sediminis TaxID=2751370 RepID=UPI001AA07734